MVRLRITLWVAASPPGQEGWRSTAADASLLLAIAYLMVSGFLWQSRPT